jgi:hypothetical protein
MQAADPQAPERPKKSAQDAIMRDRILDTLTLIPLFQ